MTSSPSTSTQPPLSEASAPGLRQICAWIRGERVPLADAPTIPSCDLTGFNQQIYGQVFAANHWQIEAAIETATRVQPSLSQIPLETRIECLRSFTKRFLRDADLLEALGWLSGVSFSELRGELSSLRHWGGQLGPFLSEALPGQGSQTDWRPSAPAFFLLPSNSDIEVALLLFQSLLSGNAAVVRPSRRGSSAYCLDHLMETWCDCVDELLGSEESSLLKSAISLIPTDSKVPWSQLAIDGWNYVLFGSNGTLQSIEEEILSRADPRKILKYGTGLSTAIVANDADVEKAASLVLVGATSHAGNNCLGTDIVYVDVTIAERFHTTLLDHLSRFRSATPDHDGCGLVSEANTQATIAEVDLRNHLRSLRVDPEPCPGTLHPSVLPLNDLDTAIEYPAPVLSLRVYEDGSRLGGLIDKDLRDNAQDRSLVTSIFTESDSMWKTIQPLTRAWLCRRNLATHAFNPMLPHQGTYLARELSEAFHLDESPSSSATRKHTHQVT